MDNQWYRECPGCHQTISAVYQICDLCRRLKPLIESNERLTQQVANLQIHLHDLEVTVDNIIKFVEKSLPPMESKPLEKKTKEQ
jgi:hypothetical protein